VGYDEVPEFGYGRGRRPLWTARDRDGEAIRVVLRRAGLREWTDRHTGFVVEGGEDGEGFLVASPGAPDVGRIAAALAGAGYRAVPDPDDDQTLRVWR
jgi:hypothetical protein